MKMFILKHLSENFSSCLLYGGGRVGGERKKKMSVSLFHIKTIFLFGTLRQLDLQPFRLATINSYNSN